MSDQSQFGIWILIGTFMQLYTINNIFHVSIYLNNFV